MNKLGAWGQYIDEPAVCKWYTLPDDLSGDLRRFHPDGTELKALSASQWRTVHNAAVRYVRQSVSSYDNAYHNDEEHFEFTEKAGMEAVTVYERLTGHHMPLAVKQAFALALRLHDCHHCGSTFRADSIKPLYRPELGARVAQEWVSADAANQFAKRHGMNVPSRLFQVMVIWASTYGGNTDRGLELGIPDVRPVGLWGRIMRAADVCLASADTFAMLARSFRVNFGENPKSSRPTTWREMIENQLAFLAYVGHCFDQLDEVAGVRLTDALGWRSKLRTVMAETTELLDRNRHAALVSRIDAELRQYGISLR